MDQLGESIRKLILAGIGAAAVTKEKSESILRDLVKKGELTVEQGKVLNEELKHSVKEATRGGFGQSGRRAAGSPASARAGRAGKARQGRPRPSAHQA